MSALCRSWKTAAVMTRRRRACISVSGCEWSMVEIKDCVVGARNIYNFCHHRWLAIALHCSRRVDLHTLLDCHCVCYNTQQWTRDHALCRLQWWSTGHLFTVENTNAARWRYNRPQCDKANERLKGGIVERMRWCPWRPIRCASYSHATVQMTSRRGALTTSTSVVIESNQKISRRVLQQLEARYFTRYCNRSMNFLCTYLLTYNGDHLVW